MNMEKYDVRELVEKIYELDVKVYEATGSTMGKVFPAGKDLSVKKMLKHLDEDKRHFLFFYDLGYFFQIFLLHDRSGWIVWKWKH